MTMRANSKRAGAEGSAAKRPRVDARTGFRPKFRLLTIISCFVVLFVTVAVRTAAISVSEPDEPRSSGASAAVFAQRSDIVDRNGSLLATNLPTNSLYVRTEELRNNGNLRRAAEDLAEIFPDLNADDLQELFLNRSKFAWIKRKLSPEQAKLVNDIGEPGVYLGSREVRVYPNGKLAAHILGGTVFGLQDSQFAEVKGNAGVEKEFDEFVRDPAHRGKPLQLSIDARIQEIIQNLLNAGLGMMSALGGSAILMDAHSGEIIALVSMPAFDPNDRQAYMSGSKAEENPLFNRAAQGVYELGSTFKIFAVAQAIELGLVSSETVIDTRPFSVGQYKIKDNYGKDSRTVEEIIVKSSNIGTARLALMIGPERQKSFLGELGLLDPLKLELSEAKNAKPKWPSRWQRISTVTISYGHGIAVSPMHLAAAYATIINGGTKVEPTIIMKDGSNDSPERVISEETSAEMRMMLRKVVLDGTASIADIKGYSIGGKTGTAEKPSSRGGYDSERVLSTFASFFPVDNPEYVLVISLDEPKITDGEEALRTAGWTAVPIAGEIVTRVAPVLGIWPETSVE